MHTPALKISVLLLVLFVSSFSFGQDRPNVVFLLADDMGYADAACLGHPYAKTPAIDQLAKEGTTFRSYYAAASTCLPSRFGLITGRFPSKPTILGEKSLSLLDELTVPAFLKKQGYRTGHFGKWHLGPTSPSAALGLDELQELKGELGDSRGRDAIVADAAIDFIEKHQSVPFFVNVWFHTPHHPVAPNSRYSERFSGRDFSSKDFANTEFVDYLASFEREFGSLNESFQNYLGDVSQLDDQIGRILRCIEDAGIKDRTIVIFSSDNGPARSKFHIDAEQRRMRRNAEESSQGGEERQDSSELRSKEQLLGYAGPLRGGKHSIYEGGIRTPWIIRWPGRVPAGRVDESSIISAVDLFPTLAAIVGLPEGGEERGREKLDGEDVSKTWFGDSVPRRRELYWQTTNTIGPKFAVRQGRWKLCEFSRRDVKLFDLENDYAEQINVADTNPTVVSDLTNLLKNWKIKFSGREDPIRDDVPNEVSEKPKSLLLDYLWGAIRAVTLPFGIILAVVISLWWFWKRSRLHTP